MDMVATDSPDVRVTRSSSAWPVGVPSRGYLEFLNLFRVLACAEVVGNHSFIWANMSTNIVGTGFVTMLHVSRNAFFFLSGLVICYSQIAHPRGLRAFWRRRYTQLGVPYLAWTGIYLLFSLLTISLGWHEVWSFLRQNLLMGYSQLYPAFVIFSFCLVFPLLHKLLRATSRHGLIMGVSLSFGLFLGATLHYPWLVPWATDAENALSSVVPWSRDLLTYQEFFVAGTLVALHLDAVCAFVRRHMRRIFVVSGAVGALMVLWYAAQVDGGASLLRASDAYQPVAVLWYFAAIAAMFAGSLWCESRRKEPTGPRRPGWTTSAGLAAMTGGVWLSHNLFLTSLRSVLGATGLRSSLPWEATVGVLFVGTVLISGTFVSLILRTRLRWVLGGPVRAEQRAEYGAWPETPSASMGQPEGVRVDYGPN
jgi:hypothetical protein